jgi:aminopeptidase N
MQMLMVVAAMLSFCLPVSEAAGVSGHAAEYIIGPNDIVKDQVESVDSMPVDLGFNPQEFLERLAAQEGRSFMRQRESEKRIAAGAVTNCAEYDVTYYDIQWIPNYATQSISGTVGIYGRPTVSELDSVIVNLSSALTVDSVFTATGPLAFIHEDEHLKAYLDRPFQQGEEFGFNVTYHGQPVPGFDGWGGLNFTTHNGMPAIEMLSEPYTARQWWPCNDISADKADSIDIAVTVDTGFVASCNGMLVADVDHGDGTHTMHWRHRYPIATYLICLAISKYQRWDDYYHYSETDSMLIINYVFPDIDSVTRPLLSMAPGVLAVLSDLFGQYPFINEKYGQTLTEMTGMEHQTNTFISADTGSPENQEYVLIHEMGHHWWGDMITCRTWHDVWLNEGFTTYSDALYHEKTKGAGYYHYYMFIKETWPTTYSAYGHDTTSSHNVFHGAYYRGAWVLHMMRHVVGDSVFFEILRQYRQTYAYGTADTDDFQSICEQVSGQDWDTFFQQWVYGGYYPTYKYSFANRPAGDGQWKTHVYLEQVQTNGPSVFVMPVDVIIYYNGGYAIVPVFNDRRQQNFVITSPIKPMQVGVDPNNWIWGTQSQVPYSTHIINDTLMSARQGTPYVDTVEVVSLHGDFAVEIVSGMFPSGWELHPTTGIISGVTDDTGTFTFTVKATDAFDSQLNDSREYTVAVAPIGYAVGDANGDGQANVGDAVFLINFVFKSGPPPGNLDAGDANADCNVNVGDAVYLINFVFKGGPTPKPVCVN